ncbi:tetratricopeptide repeat protein, partial [bacterium]|nr:tetratricopeptide repeat protein [bacterium]
MKKMLQFTFCLQIIIFGVCLTGCAQRQFTLGNQAMRDFKYHEAIMQYDRALKADASMYEAHYNMGNALMRLRQYKQAVTAYEEALERQPNDKDIKHNLEIARKQLKNKSGGSGSQSQPESQP